MLRLAKPHRRRRPAPSSSPTQGTPGAAGPAAPSLGGAYRRPPGSNGYHSDALIEIQGSLHPDNGHLLILNKQTPIPLQWLQFVMLILLASLARGKAGYAAPIPVCGGDYLQPTRIASLIEDLYQGRLGCAGLRWPACGNSREPKDVHDAKWALRERLANYGQNPDLLDAVRGVGYRLSVPPGRIKITITDPAGVKVFDWVL
jgi:hypothetical protein